MIGRCKPILPWPDLVVLVGLIAIHLAPIWTHRIFPSQDGPLHLENAIVIAEHPAPESTAFREYYTVKWRPMTNQLGHLIMAAASRVGSPLFAEKVLLSTYVILLPLSVAYLVAGIAPGALAYAALSFPFVFNYPLHMGFYNFCLSMALGLFLFGLWIRHLDRFSKGATLGMGTLALLSFLAHPTSLCVVFLAFGALSVWHFVYDLAAGTRPGRRLAVRCLPFLVATLPAALMLLVFLKQTTVPTSYLPDGELWQSFVGLSSLVSYNPDKEAPWARGVFLTFVTLLGIGLVWSAWRTKFKREHGYLFVVLVLVALYFGAPNTAQTSGAINQRFLLFPFLFFPAWLAAIALPSIVKRGAQCMGGILAIALLVQLSGVYSRFNALYDEFLSVLPQIPENSVVYSLCPDSHGYLGHDQYLSRKVDPVNGSGSYVAALRRSINVANIEGYYPCCTMTEFKPTHNPVNFGNFTSLTSESQLAMESFRAGNGSPIDYVIVWGTYATPNGKLNFYARQVEKHYDLVYETALKRVRLYRYRRSHPEASRRTRRSVPSARLG